VNRGYLNEFIFDPGQPSEAMVHRDVPETSRSEGQATQALIHYRKVNAIFDTSLIEGTTAKERAIYVNIARWMVLTGPPSTPSRQITFSDADAHNVLFLHNDALVVTMHIRNCRVSKIIVDAGSNINILYWSVVDRM